MSKNLGLLLSVSQIAIAKQLGITAPALTLALAASLRRPGKEQ